MKKFSLTTLVLALLLSLAAPAYAADATAFSDAGEIKNWEAVAALGKLGVIDGKADGSFDPSGGVTRTEAAKLLFVLAHGGKDEQVKEGKDKGFSDTAGHWAEKYIVWCVRENIISGRGDGSFDPDGEVTGVELVKMVEVLLGYDPFAYALVGPKWAQHADELGIMLKLYEGTSFEAADDPLVPASREEAAQILYNALGAGVHIIVESPVGPGAYVYEDKKDENGAPVTQLMERFGISQVGNLPTQPGKKR